MEPRLVIVIGTEGIRLIRLVCRGGKEEEISLGLYLRIRKLLDRIDKVLRKPAICEGGDSSDHGKMILPGDLR